MHDIRRNRGKIYIPSIHTHTNQIIYSIIFLMGLKITGVLISIITGVSKGLYYLFLSSLTDDSIFTEVTCHWG